MLWLQMSSGAWNRAVAITWMFPLLSASQAGPFTSHAASDRLNPIATIATDSSPSPSAQSPTITLGVSSGLPGTVVAITGSGFPPYEVVGVYLDVEPPFLPDRDGVVKPPGPAADAQGTFRETIVMPGASYDKSGRVKPTVAGLHAICGDTTYPSSTQRMPARACAQFQVLAGPSPSATADGNNPGGATGAALPELLGALAIFIAIAVGAVLWIRRSQ